MSEIGVGLRAALLLARGRADGLALLTGQPDDAMQLAGRSFFALPVAALGFVGLHLIGWLTEVAPTSTAGGHAFAQDALSFVIGWIGFALLSHRIARTSGRAALWPRYITAWNWCNVVQYMMLVTASVPALLGLPDPLVQACWLIATGWALWLEYFTTKLALGLPAPQAIAMVALDFGLGVVVVLLMGTVG